VVMEAMASGCAVLATDVGAVSTMVGDDNGWLIEPRSAKALEEKIKELLHLDTKTIEQKKVASVKKVKDNFLWDEIIKQEIAAIRRITGKP
jgi:glycosyltransferase involved in cell wall biosynthesis